MKKIGLILTLIFSITSPLCGLAQDEPASVRGRITTLWGEPIAEADVSFYKLNGIFGNSPTEILLQHTVTDGGGNYRVSGLPFGQYRVEVGLRGYGRTESWRYYLWMGADRILDLGVPSGMTDHLSAITLSGSVRGPNRTPIKDATVTLVNAFNNRQSNQLRTDANGRFKFEIIQPGQYIVYATRPGFIVSATTVDLRNGSKQAADLVLKGGTPRGVRTR